MTQPSPQGKFVKPGVTVTAALLVSLLFWETSGKYMNTPQPVIENNVHRQWCAGLTGIPKQDYYTDEDCDRLTAGHLNKDVSQLNRCLPMEDMPERIQFVARHLSYNFVSGPATVCKSTMAKHWRAGDYSPASCRVILRYTYVAGQDCRVTGKRCPGIVKRRDYEYGVCTGQIDWREQAWKYGED